MSLFKRNTPQHGAGSEVRMVGNDLYTSTRMIEAFIAASKVMKTDNIKDEANKAEALRSMRERVEQNKTTLRAVGFDVDRAWSDNPSPDDFASANEYLAARKARHPDRDKLVDEIFNKGRRGPKEDA